MRRSGGVGFGAKRGTLKLHAVMGKSTVAAVWSEAGGWSWRRVVPGTEGTVRGFSVAEVLMIDDARGYRTRCIQRCGRCWRYGTGICG